MPEVAGKLQNRRTAYLSFHNNTIKVEAERGLFSKQREKYATIVIPEINSIELETGRQPYPKYYNLSLSFGEEQKLDFYTLDEKILEVKEKITETHKTYTEKMERALRCIHRTRANHLTSIILNLDFCYTLFKILIGLDGPVNWNSVREDYKQLVSIHEDLNLLEEPKLHKISLETLGHSIERRLVEELVNETYDILDTVYRGAVQASQSKVEYFNENYHLSFISILYRAWEKKLSTASGLQCLDEKIIEREISSLVDELASEIDGIHEPNSFEHTKMMKYLHYYIQCLEKVQVKPPDIPVEFTE